MILTAIFLGLCYSVMALGIYFTMNVFKIPDITTDGSFTLGAVITGLGLVNGFPILLIIVSAMLSGAIAGLLTGWIHTRFKIQPLLAGILVMTGLYSINLYLLGRSNLPLMNTFSLFKLDYISPYIVIIVVVVFLILLLAFLLKSDRGLAMRAIGSNEKMSRSLGISPNFYKCLGLALANALIALCGCLIVQYQSYVDINMGIGIFLSGLASVLMANSLMMLFKIDNKVVQLLVVVIGSILFQLAISGAIVLGVNPIFIKLITAMIVLLIVGIPNLRLKTK